MEAIPMALFRILHASDPHMAAQPFMAGGSSTFRWPPKVARHWRQTSHDPAPLRAFVNFAHHNRDAFDAVLVSGDLATSGDRTDLDAAYQLYTAPPANPNVSLTPAGEPTLVHWAQANKLDLLPGNHDRFRSARQLYRPGGRFFDRVFCPNAGLRFWCARQGVSHGVAIRRGNWVVHVVKADFTLHRGDGGQRFYWLPGWFGQGRVDQTTLDQLVAATNRARNDIEQRHWKPVTLWAIHFDPLTMDQKLLLLESEKLVHAATNLKVTAVLCGHTHESNLKPLAQTTFVYACGTTAQAYSPHWDCQAIEVETDDGGTSPPQVRIQWYRYGNGQFSLLASR
jgi:predicted phosphodiesterase